MFDGSKLDGGQRVEGSLERRTAPSGLFVSPRWRDGTAGTRPALPSAEYSDPADTGEGRAASSGLPSFAAEDGFPAQTVDGLIHDTRNMVMALDLYCDLLNGPGVLTPSYNHYADELRLVSGASRRLLEQLSIAATRLALEASSRTRESFFFRAANSSASALESQDSNPGPITSTGKTARPAHPFPAPREVLAPREVAAAWNSDGSREGAKGAESSDRPLTAASIAWPRRKGPSSDPPNSPPNLPASQRLDPSVDRGEVSLPDPPLDLRPEPGLPGLAHGACRPFGTGHFVYFGRLRSDSHGAR